LVRHVNQGVFGSVFLAKQDGKDVAVKKLLLSESDEKHGNYKREIHALLECDHPNVIKLIETATNSRNEKFLIMDFCKYDLRKLLRIYPRLDTPLIKNFMKQILEGLNYLHSKNIIHRDLKSENLLINAEGVVKIGDLGSSRKWTSYGQFSPNMVTLRYR